MLFGGRLAAALVRIDLLQQGLLDGRDDLRNAYGHAAELSDTIVKLTVTTLSQQQEMARLREKCAELAAHIKELREVPTQFASGPLFMSEEEEDAQYDFQHGKLSLAEYEDKLKEMGLDPNITID